MKRILFVLLVLSLVMGACLPTSFQSQQPAASATALLASDLEATAAVLSQQTLQALPTNTSVPSETPVVVTATNTEVPATATETQNPNLLTLTATLGTGTVAVESSTQISSIAVGTLPLTGTPSPTFNPNASATPTIDPQPLFHGTLPPSLPSNDIRIINKAKADAYISLRCETKDGYVTYIEYPVKRSVDFRAPIGQYTYVAWVGGNKMTGSFSLSSDKDLTITLYKNKVTFK
ncbi:MAG: hypothetical protein UZ14_CFX002000350 [Chloroflexi bacterium OLB14]|nr:MAG: hypothetical protein UZ14_CFX002000350 [Chloroflexi bacterium OLB14]